MSAIVEAISYIFTWPNLLFLVGGTIISIVFGAIPGLGGIVAMSLILPLTFALEPGQAMILLSASVGGAAFGGSISAILFNVPGTGGNLASTLDGYPMSKQGRAAEAIGISATASALGAILGLVVLALLIPVMGFLLATFRSPEFFWVAVLGLLAVSSVAQENLMKGVISTAFGLALTFVGIPPISPQARFTFGSTYLLGGMPLVPLLIGIFAVSEILLLFSRGGTITRATAEDGRADETGDGGPPERVDSVWRGVRSVLENPVVFLRSALTGTLIGILPGAGGSIATFIAYGQTANASKHPERFGQGEPTGLLSSEAANDSAFGGALLPTVVFGIPGGAVTAVLLGGFIMHGITPGSEMLNENLYILYAIIGTLILSNVMTSAWGVLFAQHLKRITEIPVFVIIPPILAFSMLGTFLIRNNTLDLVVALVFGVIGIAMIRFGYSRVALILGFILGPIIERRFLLSLNLSDSGALIFFTRPASMVLVVVIAFTLAVILTRLR